MRRKLRTAIGLIAFVTIQAVGVVVLSRNWAAAETQSDARLFLTLGAYMVFMMVGCGAAALIWGGNGPPTDRVTDGPQSPPPALSPAGLPIGPRRPSPLVAHAVSAADGDA
jgi:hypothetical protein